MSACPQYVRLCLYERNDPLVEVLVRRRSADNRHFSSYDLTGKLVECYIKASEAANDGLPAHSTADGSIIITYPNGLHPDDRKASAFLIQFLAMDLSGSGRRFIHIDAVDPGGHRDTLGAGYLDVIGI